MTPRPPNPPADLPSVRRPLVEPLDEGLLDRWLRGAATEADAALIAQWIARDPQRGAELRALEAVARTPRGDVPAIDCAAQYQRFLARRGPAAWLAQEAREQRTRPRGSRELGHTPSHLWPQGVRGAVARPTWQAAAFVVVVGVVTVLGAIIGHLRPTASRSGADHTYATAAGQQRTVTLPDGTQLTLAPASRASVRLGHGRASRDVVLEGEAFFAVAHDAQRPFVVRARDAIVTDVGTRFGIRAYPGDRTVRVAVAEGAVNLRMTRSSVGAAPYTPTQLSAGDLAYADSAGVTWTHDDAAREDALAWARGCLAFRRAPLRDVVGDVGRWYDVDVSVPDSAVAARRLTATICSQSLADALGALDLPLGLRYERKGRQVTLRDQSDPR